MSRKRNLVLSGSLVADPRHAPAAPEFDSLTRRAPLSTSTYDSTARTVEAVLSAGSAVRRWGFVERLEISKAAVDLTRVERGLVQLLDTHNAYELDAVLGRLTEARIEGAQLVGKFAFADTEAGRAAEGMVARGEIKGVSIGYRVTRWEIAEGEDDEMETRTATGWELLEVSLVPVPADADAGIRSFPGSTPDLSPTKPKERKMPFTARDGIDMIDSVRSFGHQVETLARQLVDQIVDGETTPDAAREELLRAAGAAQAARTTGVRAGPSNGSTSYARGDPTFDNPQFRASAMADALYARMAGKEPNEQSREYMRLSIPQMAAEILEQRGQRGVHRLSAHEAVGMAWRASGDAQGMVTTSDLPSILQESGNRFLMEKFAAFESPIKALAKRRSATDFRDIVGIDLSEFDDLRKVNESGELEFGSLSARKERYGLKTYGRRYTLSRQVIINDDLGAFADVLTGLARTGARLEAKVLAGLVNTNPLMADGFAVFSAEHGNLAAAAAAPSVTTLDAARKAMRAQRDLSGNPIIVAPRYVLAPPEYETGLEQLLSSTIAPTQTSETNPFAGKLGPAIDPLLDEGAWYVFSDPAVAPALEYAHLDDNAAPHVEMNEAWETLGTGYRAYHDFGAAFIDSRGAYKVPAPAE